VACERKAVTAEMWAIGLRPDIKQMLLNWVSASRTLRLLKKFRQGHCPMIGQKFSSCEPVPPTLHTKVRIEVHQPIVNLPFLQVGQQGTITSVRKDVIYVTLEAPPAPLHVTTVLTAAATLLDIYTAPPQYHHRHPSSMPRYLSAWSNNPQCEGYVRRACGGCM